MAQAIVADINVVPEGLRGEYTQLEDGRWGLKIEGDLVPGFARASEVAELKGKVNEFRDNNVNLMKQLERFKDVDPEEYRKLKERIAGFEKKGTKTADEVDQRIQDALKPVLEQLEKERQEKEKGARALAERDLERRIEVIGQKLGVDEKAGPDFLARARRVFDIDGKAKDSSGNTLYSRKNPGQPMDVEEWAEQLMNDAPHLFKQSRGGGATPSGTPAAQLRPGVTRLVNPTPQDLGRFAKEIAEGKMVVVGQ